MTDREKIAEVINDYFGVDAAYFDVDPFELADHLLTNGMTVQKKGEWSMVDEYCNHAKEFRCSVCGCSTYYDHYTRRCDYDYCPNCGANMEDEYA